MTEQREIGRFFRHSAIYAVGNAVNRLGAFVLLPVYTRFLSVPEYGQLELFYVLSAVASGLLSIGIAHATLRFYFEYADMTDRRAVVSTNFLATTGIGLVGLIPVAAFAAPISRALMGTEALTIGVYLILANVVLELGCQVGLAYVRAIERSKLFIALSIGKLGVQVGTNVVLLAVFHAGVTGVLIGNVLAVLVGWLALVSVIWRGCGMRFDGTKLMPILRYSLPFLLSTILGLIAANVDRVLISGLLDFRALGIYALGIKLAKLLSDLIGEPFAQAYGAFRFSIMLSPEAAGIQARIGRYLVIGATFCALGLLFFIGFVVHLVATPDYFSALDLLPVLTLAAVLQLLTYPTQTGILVSKNTHLIFRVNLLLAAVGTGATYVLVDRFGVKGAPYAALLTAAVGLIAFHTLSQRYFRVTYDMKRIVAVAALGIAFYFVARALGEGLGPVGLLYRAVLLGSFLGLALAVGTTRQERQDLVALIRRLRSRP